MASVSKQPVRRHNPQQRYCIMSIPRLSAPHFLGIALAVLLLCLAAPSSSSAKETTIYAECSITSGGQTHAIKDAAVLRSEDEGLKWYNIERADGKPLLEGILSVSITEIKPGLAQVSGVTTSGINSRWGKASFDSDCWAGSDFRICIGTKTAADGNNTEFNPKTLEKMSVFLSNFTEVGMLNFDAANVLDPNTPEDMIHFGIWHNYINNFKTRIKHCTQKGCKWGSLTIDGSFVRESLQRYFAYNPTQLPSVDNSNHPYHFDGKSYHFEGADGDPCQHAHVQHAEILGNGNIRMTGIVYNPDIPEDILGEFTATARPHTWKGKETWYIVNLKTDIR